MLRYDPDRANRLLARLAAMPPNEAAELQVVAKNVRALSRPFRARGLTDVRITTVAIDETTPVSLCVPDQRRRLLVFATTSAAHVWPVAPGSNSQMGYKVTVDTGPFYLKEEDLGEFIHLEWQALAVAFSPNNNLSVWQEVYV